MIALGVITMNESARTPHTALGKIRAGWICGAVWLGLIVLSVIAIVVTYAVMIGLPFIFSDVG